MRARTIEVDTARLANADIPVLKLDTGGYAHQVVILDEHDVCIACLNYKRENGKTRLWLETKNNIVTV